ncbi:mucin-2 isoform X2 [Dunckerocampus dactyliophorus]|uniref:mucin-2 isoform X2 n=1 Tax=Dunckerocampus dactyliophorus TaxID=161453 RepID=UPI002404C690|nr:mucin-2 isoform X2 [Dunckerocampus dactyliophorus]
MPYTVYVRYCDVIITGLANNSPFLSSPAMTIMIATTSTIHTGCSAIMPSHLLLLGLLIMPGFTSGATSTAPTSSVSMVATSTPATTQSISSTTSRGTTMSSTSMPSSTVTSTTGAPMSTTPPSTPLIPTGSSANTMQSSSSSSGSTLPTATTTQTPTSTPLSTGSATTTMQWSTMSTNPASGGATTTAAATQTPTSTPLSTGPATSTMQWSTSSTNPASEGATTTATQTPTSSPLSTGSATSTMQPMSGGTTAAGSTLTASVSSVSAPNTGTNSASSTAMPMSTTTMMTAASPSSVSSNTDSWTSMMSTTQTTTSTGSMTSMMTTAMNMIYCPEFSCNYSDCNTMYASQNTTPCAAGQWCKLCKMDMYYMASCSASCNDSCMNDSQTNCSVACCNYTGCLNATFASMVIMPSTAAPTAAPVTTAMANPQPTTSDDGNKCNQGMCTGATCYTSFSSTLQTCSSSDLHCQLKKETVGSDLKWTAGCTANCSSETTCTATTQPPCHLECCNVTMTSCLWLNGTMNFPSSAIRGPRIHAELTASLLCLLVALGFLQ